MASERIKVFVIDITGEYEEALKELICKLKELKRMSKITGNHSEIRERLLDRSKDFSEDENLFISILDARSLGIIHLRESPDLLLK